LNHEKLLNWFLLDIENELNSSNSS
jgi:hypothetical protein